MGRTAGRTGRFIAILVTGMDACGVCASTLKSNDTALKCSGSCNRNFHSKCIACLSHRDYQTIVAIPNIRWFCDDCVDTFQMNTELIKRFNDFSQFINNQLQDFKKTLEVNHGNLHSKNHSKSYADTVKDVVIIKPKVKQDSVVTVEEIRKNVNPTSLEVGLVQLKNIKDGGVIVRCQSNEDSVKIRDAAEKKLKKKYNIKVPTLNNPCIKVIGIDEELDDNDIKTCILKQNTDILHDNLDIKVKTVKKMKTKFMCIIETDPVSYEKIMKKEKLSIGWNICRVYEYLQIFRCFNCHGFNHLAKDCPHQEKCSKCGSSEHLLGDCVSEFWRCANCADANQNLKMDLPTDHSPFSDDCTSLQRKKNLERRKVRHNSDST